MHDDKYELNLHDHTYCHLRICFESVKHEQHTREITKVLYMCIIVLFWNKFVITTMTFSQFQLSLSRNELFITIQNLFCGFFVKRLSSKQKKITIQNVEHIQ